MKKKRFFKTTKKDGCNYFEKLWAVYVVGALILFKITENHIYFVEKEPQGAY
jgi:hypothetical protein